MTKELDAIPVNPSMKSRRKALTLGLALAGVGAAQQLSPAQAQEAKDLRTSGPVVNAAEKLNLRADATMNTYKEPRRGWTYVPTDGRQIVKGSNATDEINALIQTLADQGGGALYFPPGSYVVSGLILDSRVNILGAGPTLTTFILADNSNTPVMRNKLAGIDGNENSFGMTLQGFTINGNRWGQKFDWYTKPPHSVHDPHQGMSHGILLHRLDRWNGQAIDSKTRIKEVNTEYCYHGGFFSREHGGETRYVDCYAFRNGGPGFTPGWDHFLIGNTAAQNEYEGFMLHNGSVTMTGNKTFNSGYVGSDGLIDGIFRGGRSVPGVRIRGVGHAAISSLNSQNNVGPGITIHDSSGVTIAGLLVDSNNMSATDDSKWYTFDRNHRTHQDQLDREAAQGIDSETRKAGPASFSGIEFTGKSHNNTIIGASWCSQNQGEGAGDPNGYQAHAVSYGPHTKDNLVIIGHASGNNRAAREVINPTQNQGAAQNTTISTQDRLNNTAPNTEQNKTIEELKKELADANQKITTLQNQAKPPTAPPVIMKGERLQHRDGNLKIDYTTKKAIYYHKKDKVWYNLDGSRA